LSDKVELIIDLKWFESRYAILRLNGARQSLGYY